MAINKDQRPRNSGFGALTTAAEIAAGASLHGKLVVITGGYAGIGLETTRLLAERGATVVVGVRDVAKARAATAGIARLKLETLDLASPTSIDAFAKHLVDQDQPVHLLINNAGIMAIPLQRDTRGYELQLATNHLGHFQLTARLRPLLVKARGARVITLTSAGHRFSNFHFEDPHFKTRPYDKWQAYGQSKTANSLFALELDRRERAHGIRAFAVHPGRILETDLSRHMTLEERDAMVKGAAAYITKTIPQGASTTLWCALSPQLDGLGGLYCEDCDVSEVVSDDAPLPPGVRAWAVDTDLAAKLWDVTEAMCGIRWPS